MFKSKGNFAAHYFPVLQCRKILYFSKCGGSCVKLPVLVIQMGLGTFVRKRVILTWEICLMDLCIKGCGTDSLCLNYFILQLFINYKCDLGRRVTLRWSSMQFFAELSGIRHHTLQQVGALR